MWNVTAWHSLFLNQPVFQENQIYNFKFHLFSFLNTKQANYGIFWTRLGRILIWQNFSETWGSDFRTVMVSYFSIKNFKRRLWWSPFLALITLKVVRKGCSPFISIKNFKAMMVFFFGIKNFKGRKAVVEFFLNFKSFKSRKKVTESSFSSHASLSFHMMHKFPGKIFFRSVPTEFLWLW